MNVRPYRYPAYQKDEIKKMVQELMSLWVIIQSNQNPFSFSVILVKKADGSWRLCVDYIALNQVTLKDKFIILVVK